MKKTFLACALLAASIGAQAQAPGIPPLRYIVGAGITAGGDKLATTSYTNGESSNIKAGSGLQVLAGAEYRMSNEFSLQATLGYHIYFTPEASNGDADFSRIPVELIAYFHANEQWRVGGGLRRASKPELSGSGFAAGLNEGFKDSTGAVVEVEYFVNPSLGVKLRAVNEKFESRTYGGSVKGNHVGIFTNYYF